MLPASLQFGVGCGAALTRRDGLEDRVQVLDRLGFAADHQAEAAVQPEHAAAGTDVDVVDAVGLELLRALDVVEVVGVAAVDDDVTVGKQGLELVDRRLDDCGGDHDPDGARLRQQGDEVGKAVGAVRAVGHEPFDHVRVAVVRNAVVTVAHEAAHQVCAHPAEPDHAELHWLICGHRG